MKDYIEKVLLYLVPFLVITSICYTNGYWSLYQINIYEYYQATDILKSVAMPAFSFIGLAFIPLLTIGAMTYSSLNSNNISKEGMDKSLQEIEIPVFLDKFFDKLNKNPILHKKVFYVPLIIILLGLAGYIFVQGAISIGALAIQLSPYADEKNFIEGYFYIPDNGIVRSIEACITVPLFFALASFLINLPSSISPAKSIKSSAKTFIFSFSIVSTLSLAYNAGRIDSYKIISGYDFYYRVDNNNIPHKYLGKLDKYFLFLDDRRIIKDGNLKSILSGKLPFSARISIISDDSLNALQLDRHNSSITYTDSAIYKNFIIRKATD